MCNSFDRMSPKFPRFAPSLLAASLLVLGVFASAALAGPVTVTVDGHNYTISTVTGSFNANATQLTSQVWWDNATLAQDLTTAMAGSLGYPLVGSGNLSPIVGASMLNGSYVLGDNWRQSDNSFLQLAYGTGDTTFPGSSTPSPLEWVVQVQPARSSVPDNGSTVLLMLLGLGALCFIARRTPAKLGA